jgi:hypothetical protein
MYSMVFVVAFEEQDSNHRTASVSPAGNFTVTLWKREHIRLTIFSQQDEVHARRAGLDHATCPNSKRLPYMTDIQASKQREAKPGNIKSHSEGVGLSNRVMLVRFGGGGHV